MGVQVMNKFAEVTNPIRHNIAEVRFGDDIVEVTMWEEQESPPLTEIAPLPDDCRSNDSAHARNCSPGTM